jgi:PAS domain S-box-containing protein
MNVVAEKTARHLGLTSRLSFLEMDSDGDHFAVLYDYALPGRKSALGRHRVSDYIHGDLNEAFGAGKLIVIDDIAADQHTAEHAEAFSHWDVGSMALAPFAPNERSVFFLVAQHAERYQWQPHEIKLLEELVERICNRLQLASTEQALRESENRFRTMADGTPNIIWVTDASGRLVFVNKMYNEFFGVNLEDIIQNGWQPLVHPDDAEAYTTMFFDCLQRKAPFRAQARVLRKDGEWRWVESHGLPRFSETGEFLGMAGSSPDITLRKQAEEDLFQAHEALVNERNRLLAIMEALPIGLAICDASGGVIQANPEYDDIWGSPHPIARSVDDYDVYKAWWAENGEPLKPDEWAAAQAVLYGESVTGQLLRIQRFDGDYRYVLNSAAPVRDSKGSVAGGTVAIMDVTGRVQAEMALVESKRSLQEIEARFRVALSPAPMVVYTCDHQQRYTWVYNPLVDLRAEDMLGKRDDELLPAETVQELVEAKQWALDTGLSGVREVRLFYKGETRAYILAMEPLRDPDRRVTGLTCSAIEVTEQRRLARERDQRTRQIEIQRRLIEDRDRQRQEIAREIHDGPIQTLVSTIFELQIARGGQASGAIDEAYEAITTRLKNAVSELREVVNELRPTSLLRFGFLRAIELFAEDFREKHPEITLTLNVDPFSNGLPEPVAAAIFRIYQESLNNIYRHAKATRASVRLLLDEREKNALLEITDNGVGIAGTKDLVSQTERGHYGMAGMKERAEAAGGEFFMRSKPGEGVTIRVMIPVIQQDH